MNAAFPEQIERLKSDGAEVRILSDKEVSEWELMTNYKKIQDKWLLENNEAGLKNAVLDAARKYIINK